MRYILYITFILFTSACQQTSKQHNTLTPQEEAEGWELLFDGKSLQGWHIYNQGDIDSKWTVNNGELTCDPHKKAGIFGDLTSNSSYTDFELELEWKVFKGGNSGVFINVNEHSNYAAAFATGLEMQLLDNENAEQRHQIDSTHWAGCLYAVDCISENSGPNPYGNWNHSRIIQQNGEVSFWLNGKATFEQKTNTEEFKRMIAESPMKAYPDFGKLQFGHIALQNHTDSVSFRNIKIKRL